MGGIGKALGGVFGSGGGTAKTVQVPVTPDYEEERKKAETQAQQKRAGLAAQGMAGTILGGGAGDDENVKKKKLLGE